MSELQLDDQSHFRSGEFGIGRSRQRMVDGGGA